MARADLPPGQRDRPLQLEQLVDCPECGATFDHVFTCPPNIIDKEDLVEAPIEVVVCPNDRCGHRFTAEYEGWTIHDEA